MFEQLFEKIKINFPNVERIEVKPDPYIKIDPEEVYEVLNFIKIKLNFQTLACITGVDYPEKKCLAVVYHLASYAPAFILTIKTFLPRELHPKIKSISDIYKAANWLEREIYDMFGIIFEGHPNLSRILLPDDWEGHPLRKDYLPPNYYGELPLTFNSEIKNKER